MTGPELRARRLRLGLTQAEAAARAGVARPVITNLERGHRVVVTLDLAQRLCLALKLEIRVAPEGVTWQEGGTDGRV